MFDVKVSASTPAELATAIISLAAAMQATQSPAAPVQVAPAPVPVAVNPTQPVAPTPPAMTAPAPMPVSAAPVAVTVPQAPTPQPTPPLPVTSAANPVPVAAAPAFTREQIMNAGAMLIDAGKIAELMALLESFGVLAVTQLKEEHLGSFATELRKLGAAI